MKTTTKREDSINFAKNGDWKNSLKLAKGFDNLYNKEEIETISIAYECLAGKKSFYTMLGINIEETIEKAKDIIRSKYIV